MSYHQPRRRGGVASPVPPSPRVRTRLHAVLETTDQVIYLGCRETDELGPCALANLGHVSALLRATSADLFDIHSAVAVYLEAQGGPAPRYRLHRRGRGTDPVLTDVTPP